MHGALPPPTTPRSSTAQAIGEFHVDVCSALGCLLWRRHRRVAVLRFVRIESGGGTSSSVLQPRYPPLPKCQPLRPWLPLLGPSSHETSLTAQGSTDDASMPICIQRGELLTLGESSTILGDHQHLHYLRNGESSFGNCGCLFCFLMMPTHKVTVDAYLDKVNSFGEIEKKQSKALNISCKLNNVACNKLKLEDYREAEKW
ncbi:hypothetical protein EJB05_37936, partial [Eragrostis curvula]